MNFRKKKFRIGFVPLVDCAPIVMAQEKGIFAKYGLDVELQREPGWATIRDKMAYGELEAAHSLVGLAFALTWGLGVVKTPCVTGYLLNSNGDAITISKGLYERGVTDPASLAEYLKKSRRDRPIVFGVPHLFSSHHFLLRRWLKPEGLVPGRDLQIMVLPPSLMASCLKVGNIDGFCVGEPFNTQAVQDGSGVILAESANLSPMHPEKALIVSEAFAERGSEMHLQLISAISEAAAYCESKTGRAEISRILAGPQYLGMDEGLITSSLFAGDEKRDTAVSSKAFHIFHHTEVNRPSSDKASWVVNQMRSAALLDEVDTKSLPPLKKIFREDIYDAANSALCRAAVA